MNSLPKLDHLKSFYKELDLKGSFRPDTFFKFNEKIESFLDNPENHFHNSELQKSLKNISKLSLEFIHLMCEKTFPTPHNDSKQSVRRIKFGDGEDDMESGEKLNDLASQVYVEYVSFLEKAKKHLVTTSERP